MRQKVNLKSSPNSKQTKKSFHESSSYRRIPWNFISNLQIIKTSVKVTARHHRSSNSATSSIIVRPDLEREIFPATFALFISHFTFHFHFNLLQKAIRVALDIGIAIRLSPSTFTSGKCISFRVKSIWSISSDSLHCEVSYQRGRKVPNISNLLSINNNNKKTVCHRLLKQMWNKRQWNAGNDRKRAKKVLCHPLERNQWHDDE